MVIARAGSLTEAAELLGLQHSTLSRRLSKLEADRGQRLMIRGKTGCRPTAVGRGLIQQAEAMLQLLDEAHDRAEPHLEGHLRISAPEAFGALILAPELSRWLATHDQVTASVLPMQNPGHRTEQQLELMFSLAPFDTPNHLTMKAMDYQLRPYQAADGSPSDLAVGYVGDFLPAQELRYDQELFPDSRPQLAHFSLIGQAYALRQGIGLGILPDFVAQQVGGLVATEHRKAIQRTIWLSVPKSAADNAAVRQLTQHLSRTLSFTLDPRLKDD